MTMTTSAGDRSNPLFKRRRADHPTSDGEAWIVAEGESNGAPLIARFRTDVTALVGSRDYGIQIGIAIPLLESQRNGLPAASELSQLDSIEETVEVLAGESAVLVGVITTSGMREFVLYTGASDWIPAYHEALQRSVETHEVQVMAKADPDWAVYRTFVS